MSIGLQASPEKVASALSVEFFSVGEEQLACGRKHNTIPTYHDLSILTPTWDGWAYHLRFLSKFHSTFLLSRMVWQSQSLLFYCSLRIRKCSQGIGSYFSIFASFRASFSQVLYHKIYSRRATLYSRKKYILKMYFCNRLWKRKVPIERAAGNKKRGRRVIAWILMTNLQSWSEQKPKVQISELVFCTLYK